MFYKTSESFSWSDNKPGPCCWNASETLLESNTSVTNHVKCPQVSARRPGATSNVAFYFLLVAFSALIKPPAVEHHSLLIFWFQRHRFCSRIYSPGRGTDTPPSSEPQGQKQLNAARYSWPNYPAWLRVVISWSEVWSLLLLLQVLKENHWPRKSEVFPSLEGFHGSQSSVVQAVMKSRRPLGCILTWNREV